VFVLGVGRILRLRFKPNSDAGRFSRAFEGFPLVLFEMIVDECGLRHLARWKMTKAKLPSVKVRLVLQNPGDLDTVFGVDWWCRRVTSAPPVDGQPVAAPAPLRFVVPITKVVVVFFPRDQQLKAGFQFDEVQYADATAAKEATLAHLAKAKPPRAKLKPKPADEKQVEKAGEVAAAAAAGEVVGHKSM
jgi:hypothetical protein